MKLYSRVEKPIMYLSGAHTTGTKKDELTFLKRTGCKFRCYSFAYTCPGAFYYSKRMHESLDICVDAGVGIMMDSGAYSFQKFMHGESPKMRKMTPADKEKLRDETIAQYIKYCKQQGKNWDWYVNFDYVRDGRLVYKVQQQLEKAGIRPVPVFHGYYPIEWMERYCKEGYKLMSISGIAKQQKNFRQTQRYCEEVHNLAAKYGVKLHGLAVTSASLMFGFPWYSVDSTTWVRTAAMGMIILPDLHTKTLVNVHVSTENAEHETSYNRFDKHQRKQLERRVEHYGFDLKKVREDVAERRIFNATVFCQHLGPIAKAVRESRVLWESLV